MKLLEALKNWNSNFELTQEIEGVRITNYNSLEEEDQLDILSFLQSNRHLHNGFCAGVVNFKK